MSNYEIEESMYERPDWMDDDDEYLPEIKTVSYGDIVDTHCWLEPVEISREHIKALLEGKLLFWDDGEYTHLMRLKKDTDSGITFREEIRHARVCDQQK